MLASSRKAAGHRNAWGNIHFSRSLSFAAMLPGGRDRPPYNARQTAGGIKTPLCGKGHFTGICSRFWHLFPADRRAGVHARRETFRQSRRFRADEDHCRPQAAFRRLPGAQRRCKSRRSAAAQHIPVGTRPARPPPKPPFPPPTPIRREVHPARPGRYPAVNRRRSLCQTSSA